jgi:hypothetical protein
VTHILCCIPFGAFIAVANVRANLKLRRLGALLCPKYPMKHAAIFLSGKGNISPVSYGMEPLSSDDQISDDMLLSVNGKI